MKTKLFHILILCLALALLATLPVSAQGGAGIITFQGQLADANGEFLSGAYDLRFTIYDAETGGTALWGPETHSSTPVSQGLFVVQLGSVEALDGAIFDGAARWLEMAVWNGAAWEPLSPRLLMGGAAYAFSAGGLPPGTTLSGAGGAVLKVVNTADGQALQESGGLAGQSGATDFAPPAGAATDDIFNESEVEYGVVGETDDSSDRSGGVRDLEREVGVWGETRTSRGIAAGVFGVASAPSGRTYGVKGETHSEGPNASGVHGLAVDRDGTVHGVWGETYSENSHAAGVYGYANAADGRSRGVWGKTLGSSYGAAGVYGEATATLGGTFGGYFTNKSEAGVGVYAEATATSGTTYGVYAKTMSSSKNTAAVQGWANTTNGRVYGVHGATQSSGKGAAGVFGVNEAASGETFGGYFESHSTDGRGVYGRAYAKSGNTFGVFGKSDSTAGIGVYGEATAASGETYGGYFKAASGSGAALYGEAANAGVGVKAKSEKGNVIEGYGGGGLVFKVDNSGNVFADGTYQSPAADFAEMLPGDEGLEPGDVLAIAANGRVTKASAENPLAIIGVYSTAPAFLGGRSSADSEQSPARVPVAILGVVPVKVSAENGPIRPNDPLAASSIPGYAARAIPLFVLDGGEGVYAGGSILGRALEGLDSGEGVIKVLLQLR